MQLSVDAFAGEEDTLECFAHQALFGFEVAGACTK